MFLRQSTSLDFKPIFFLDEVLVPTAMSLIVITPVCYLGEALQDSLLSIIRPPVSSWISTGKRHESRVPFKW